MPAAMAVLGALYGASTPSADSLTDVQLLQVVILADMLQVTDLAEEVVATLVQAAEATQGLSEAAVQQLLSLESYPACVVSALQHITRHMQLQDTAALWAKAAAPSNPGSFEAVLAAPHSRYMQIQLLEALGDLEEVWQEDDQQQQQVLLSLPLPAMQLLLSSSALQVRPWWQQGRALGHFTWLSGAWSLCTACLFLAMAGRLVFELALAYLSPAFMA